MQYLQDPLRMVYLMNFNHETLRSLVVSFVGAGVLGLEAPRTGGIGDI
jgi:hypothetical protein